MQHFTDFYKYRIDTDVMHFDYWILSRLQREHSCKLILIFHVLYQLWIIQTIFCSASQIVTWLNYGPVNCITQLGEKSSRQCTKYPQYIYILHCLMNILVISHSKTLLANV